MRWAWAVVLLVGCTHVEREGARGARERGAARDAGPQGWVPAQPMAIARANHSALRLHDGRVLVLGGAAGGAAELWDPADGRWSPAGTQTVETRVSGLERFPAVELADHRVYVFGQDHPQLWEPATRSFRAVAKTGAWAVCGVQALEALPDGRVLAIYDECAFSSDDDDRRVEVWDPRTDRWQDPDDAQARRAPRPFPEDMHVGRVWATPVRLAPGLALVAGGAEPTNQVAETDGVRTDWIVAGARQRGPDLLQARSLSGVAVTRGRVILAGGLMRDGSGSRVPLAQVETLTPGTGARWQPAPPLRRARYLAAATVLADGRVMLSGGVVRGGCPDMLAGDLGLDRMPDWQACEATREVEIWNPR